MILAIDSLLGTSVALVGPSRVVAEASHPGTRSHAEVVGELIARVFADANARPGDVTLVASGIGPGPFTGLRVGMAAARAFAVARGVEEVGVLSHDAAALDWLEHHYARARTGLGPLAPAVTIATDARRRQLFASSYSGLDAHWLPVRVGGPKIVPQTSEPQAGRHVPEAIHAGFVGLIAARRREAGIAQEAPTPRYLRDPDVTPSHGQKRVTQ